MSINLAPYIKLARIDRPIGTWLLLFPCWWALAFFPLNMEVIKYYILFGLGAFFMRGAGCTFNDIIDRKIDAQVERTKHRPLAAGEISVTHALVFMSVQCLLGMTVLLLMPFETQLIGLGGLALLLVYPFAKRFTNWPQLVLGMAFNFGVIMAWSAPQEMSLINLTPWALYLAGIFWTLAYDTIYALQDISDDMRIGVKSTAVLFGERVISFIDLFYALFFVALILAGYIAELHLLYYAVLGIGYLSVFWQRLQLDPADPESCRNKFRANQWVGWIVLLAIHIGKL